MKKLYLLIAVISVATLSVVFGYRLNNWERAKCATAYSFINTNVVCGDADVILKTGYAETRGVVLKYIEERRAAGEMREGSVYFRDLVHGPIFGINEFEDFVPASLLKLPLAVVFLKAAETDASVLTSKVQFSGTTTVDKQRVKPSESAVHGRFYTIEDMLRLMLVHSDNAAYETLESLLAASPERTNFRSKTFQEMGLISPVSRIEETITVRGYASLFRLLYHVSFLDTEYSEKILGWLAETTFTEGLRQGVPAGTRVAHKFGERILSDGTKQLHDCGVVYFPGNPYLLCVMTKGNDWNELTNIIATISRIVYDEVDSRKM